jgi:polysaccharide export outer membrane protein
MVPANAPTAVSATQLSEPAEVNSYARQEQSPNSGRVMAASATDPSSRNAQNAAGLAALFRERTSGAVVKDYPIGPGDVLEVSVPPIDELAKRTVRVEADGTISLPMLGTMRAAGLTQEQLCAELRGKLRTYMYQPDVEVFVKQYNSREVAVVGAVNSPGLITLSAPNETVLDMLTRAGGLSQTAANEVILLPVEYSSQPATGRISQVSAETPAPMDGLHQSAKAAARSRAAFQRREVSALLRQNSHPLIIGLKGSALTGAGGYLNMPVRPGDVLVVPGGGQVMVIGWVQNPGHFQVGSGLTVLGAIGAAGGPMYAANTSDIHLIRTRRDGSKLVLTMNLNKIKSGTERDLAVRANDVIDVPYSDLKIGPYVFYNILTRMYVGGPSLPTP